MITEVRILLGIMLICWNPEDTIPTPIRDYEGISVIIYFLSITHYFHR